MVKIVIMTIFFMLSTLATALPVKQNLDQEVQGILDEHYKQYKDLEYFSGATLSYYVPGQTIKNYYTGYVSRDPESEKISANSLFQIGSITKSFTAAIMLDLEKKQLLNLNQTLKEYLPTYPKWSGASLKQLINMTSGLPNYSDTPLWNAAEIEIPNRKWSNQELIHYVYPNDDLSPPLKKGYFYSNTNYVLLDLIIQKVSQHSYKTEIELLIKKAKLENTFYPLPEMDIALKSRLTAGYAYNQYDNPSLVGSNVGSNNNLSWAGAAGALISNSEDIIKWVKVLFIDKTLLNPSQKEKLMQIVSQQTGKPIAKTSKEDKHGFGLGVAQGWDQTMGNFWFYEGQTLGYRALYLYSPNTRIIVSVIFNSSTNAENDHAGDLMKKVYQLLLKDKASSKTAMPTQPSPA